MIQVTQHRGLDTLAPHEEATLQNMLVAQFEKLDPRERMKAFIGQEEIEGSMNREEEGIELQEVREAPILWMMPTSLEQTSVALQQWEGMVTSIRGTTFFARLKDVSAESVEEEIEMQLDDISEDDKELVQLGAIFYWSIGRETTAAGQVKRSSVIKFRRLPAWSSRELDTARQKAADVRRLIGWGDADERSQAG